MTLEEIVTDKTARMLDIPEEMASEARDGRTWSSKQELGHLIDSALNNYGRFVRATLDGHYTGPSYSADGWVALGGYEELGWVAVILLWRDLNLRLAHVINRIPAERMSALCTVGTNEPVTLEYLIGDYKTHLLHHIDQIFT